MKLKISPNLKKAMEQNKKMTIDKNNKGFKISTDLDNFDEDIYSYVVKHTSGIKYDYLSSEGGLIIVSFDEFKRMVDDGYNIISADIISDNMISIEYQKEIKRSR